MNLEIRANGRRHMYEIYRMKRAKGDRTLWSGLRMLDKKERRLRRLLQRRALPEVGFVVYRAAVVQA